MSAPPATAPPMAPITGPDPALDRVLRLARRRMRANRALAAAGPAVLTVAAIVLAWTVVARYVPVALPGVTAITALAVAAGVVVAGAAAVRIPATWAALAADRWLGEPDTYATAVALRDTSPVTPLACEHVRRTHERAAAVDAIPGGPRLPTRALSIAAICLLAAGLTTVAGDPQRAARERAAAEVTATAEQAAALREAARDVAERGPAAEPAVEQLDRLAEQLDGADLDTALERLDTALDDLAVPDAGQLAAQRTALAGLEQALRRNPVADGGSSQAQLDALASDLADGAVDRDRREELAQQLADLADALAGQPEVAAALDRAAAQLASGGANAGESVAGASAAIGEAAAQLASGEASAAAGAAIEASNDALRRSDAALAAGQTSTPSAAGPSQGTGQAQAPGAGQGQGQNPAAGQGRGQGQGGTGGGGGGGSGARDTGQRRDGRGSAAARPGDATRNRPEGRFDDQTVYDPRPDATGEDLQIQGRDTDGPAGTAAGTSQGPGRRNTALVPYTEVYARYSRQATQTVEQPGYPLRLRDVVRDYFGGLAEP